MGDGTTDVCAGDVPEDEARDDGQPGEEGYDPVFVLVVKNEAGDPPAMQDERKILLVGHHYFLFWSCCRKRFKRRREIKDQIVSWKSSPDRLREVTRKQKQRSFLPGNGNAKK